MKAKAEDLSEKPANEKEEKTKIQHDDLSQTNQDEKEEAKDEHHDDLYSESGQPHRIPSTERSILHPDKHIAFDSVDMLFRPCVDCSLITGCFCDRCYAADRCPQAEWEHGKNSPLCIKCDKTYDSCHLCRRMIWCTPASRRRFWRFESSCSLCWVLAVGFVYTVRLTCLPFFLMIIVYLYFVLKL